MNKSIILLLLICSTLSPLFGQESDTTEIKPKVNLTDTIPDAKEIDENESVEIMEDDAPKIIYYQNTKMSRKKSNKRDRREIKTLSGSMSHSGGFGALSFRSTEFNDESIVLAGLRGGWIINRTLAIGLEGHGIIPTSKFDDIVVGREANILGGYGGMFMELIFFSNQVVHITFPVSGGAGWLGYQLTNENSFVGGYIDNNVDDDVFWYVEPGASVEFNISRNFRLSMGLSQRFSQDLELIRTAPDDFDNLNYFITLKIGGF